MTPDVEQVNGPPDPPRRTRTLEELRTSGLLWLINTSVFHPRGVSLALDYSTDGESLGWSIQGDGSEPWVFEDGPELKAKFEQAQATITKMSVPPGTVPSTTPNEETTR